MYGGATMADCRRFMCSQCTVLTIACHDFCPGYNFVGKMNNYCDLGPLVLDTGHKAPMTRESLVKEGRVTDQRNRNELGRTH